ncbi:MAG: hypothetical protein R3227_13060, partial [Reinekea sp.]|nr:hypothetical protein [Reinekea sp.]
KPFRKAMHRSYRMSASKFQGMYAKIMNIAGRTLRISEPAEVDSNYSVVPWCPESEVRNVSEVP